jgi:signal transduction histidine kinase
MKKLNKSAELITANKQLALLIAEKETRATELIIANKELSFQNEEKEQRASELVVANKELAYQNKEKEARAAELVQANIELAFQNNEKESRAVELRIAYRKLKKTEGYLKQHILDLEEMMFITSHKVRQPVANIMGLSNILDECINSPVQLTELVRYLNESAQSLDVFTQELTLFIRKLERIWTAKLHVY